MCLERKRRINERELERERVCACVHGHDTQGGNDQDDRGDGQDGVVGGIGGDTDGDGDLDASFWYQLCCLFVSGIALLTSISSFSFDEMMLYDALVNASELYMFALSS